MPPTRDVGDVNEVTIVSTNPERLDGLRTYLRGAGIAARCARELGAKSTRETTTAFVVFADDFRWERVIAALADLAESSPKTLPVLVTAQPQRFRSLTSAESVLIVSRPAWGWTILDAICAHLETQAPGGGARQRAQ